MNVQQFHNRKVRIGILPINLVTLYSAIAVKLVFFLIRIRSNIFFSHLLRFAFVLIKRKLSLHLLYPFPPGQKSLSIALNFAWRKSIASLTKPLKAFNLLRVKNFLIDRILPRWHLGGQVSISPWINREQSFKRPISDGSVSMAVLVTVNSTKD